MHKTEWINKSSTRKVTACGNWSVDKKRTYMGMNRRKPMYQYIFTLVNLKTMFSIAFDTMHEVDNYVSRFENLQPKN